MEGKGIKAAPAAGCDICLVSTLISVPRTHTRTRTDDEWRFYVGQSKRRWDRGELPLGLLLFVTGLGLSQVQRL